ncbi:hypothetical protein [Knoellia sinensis]|uniref:hypothetical protein n=1 Tax=Knoellia sinensis TaxID=136100 RepID=UPI0012EC4FA4|nr:hypothetical protein [Knoellia sinensis]
MHLTLGTHARRWGVATLPLMLLLTGCVPGIAGVSWQVDEKALAPRELAQSMTFDFEDIGGSGRMDQTLIVTNTSGVPILLNADVQALDASGKGLPDVRVSGIYGATGGRQVLLPGENVEVLVFGGPNAAKATDVRVTNIKAKGATFPNVSHHVDATPVDETGTELDDPVIVSAVRVTNANKATVSVGVVCIVWDRPQAGEPQQALEVIPLASVVELAAGQESTLRLNPQAQAKIRKFATSNAISFKAFFTQG